MDKNLSKSFNFLRFPLAVLVVYLHIMPVVNPGNVPIFDSVGHQIYFYTNILVNGIAQAAVPCFFVISGYLLVRNINKLTPTIYWQKVKNRFVTLFIPYILWNLLAAIYLYLTHQINGFPSFEFLFLAPANFPLWFLRNLIVMVLLFPVFYYVAKLGGSLVFILILGGYISESALSLYFNVPHFGWMEYLSCFFFFAGIYAGMNKWNLQRISAPTKIYVWLSTACLFFIRFLPFPEIIKISNNLTLVLLVVSCFLLADSVVKHFKTEGLPILASATFFIYLSHKLGATYIAKKALTIMPVTGHWSELIVFIVAPLLAVIICLIVYSVVKKLLPNGVHPYIGIK